MKVINKQDLIKNIADSWLKQYPSNSYLNTPKWEVYLKLKSLDGSQTADDINKIIGNNSWTVLLCDQCSKDVNHVVGIMYDYGIFTTICKDCLKEALSMLELTDGN